MSTVAFTNGILVFGGQDLSGDLNQLGLEYSAEILDATTFGVTTRIHKGGLTTVRLTGRGYVQFGSSLVDEALATGLGVDDNVIVVFANGATQGTATDKGFAFKVTQSSLTRGGTVGELLPFDVAFEGRGIEGAA